MANRVAIAGNAVRVFVFCFGLLSGSWALYVAPITWVDFWPIAIAGRIVAEEPYKANYLSEVSRELQHREGLGAVRAPVLRAAAIIEIRLLETTFARGDFGSIDSLLRATGGSIRKSLMNAPADPFLWTVLFWLENTRAGFSESHLELLRLSYALGRNEGWIGVKRSRFALSLYPSLTPDLAGHAVNEYSRLVASGFFDAAADILGGPGWPVRDALMQGLANLDEATRQTFARRVYSLGYDVSVPGIDRPDWRPWH